MPNFLFLFWGKNDAPKPASPEQMERAVNAWMSWTDDLRKQGKLSKAGERLSEGGKMVRGKAKVVTDGPYAEAKDTIGGYLLVQADDLEQAAELAKGCPILENNGMVEVRPVVSM